MIGKPIGIKACGRVVLDPIGAPQSRADYELQAIAYARWIARRNGVSLRRAHSAQIPNPNPDLAHRCWNLSLLAGAA